MGVQLKSEEQQQLKEKVKAKKSRKGIVLASLAVIADTDHLYIGVNIEETDIARIKVGQRVDVKLDAYSGVIFPGRVQEIDRATQTYFSGTSSFSTSGTYAKVTQLIPVKVVIDNQDNLPLTFGMNATVKIHLKEEPVNTPIGDQEGEPTDSLQVVHYSSVIEAAAQMASAQAGLDIAQKKLDDCIVRAPMAGEVAAKTIEVGMMASPQAAAMTLINTQEVKVHINVTETNISEIKAGGTAEIKVQAIDAAAQGKVVSIAPASDAKTGMFQIEVLLENPAGLLKAGMICDVELS